ncbi:hypothetical protein KC327_g13578 [Hortaea werneckii]|nr:hypothetical protein KC358_g13786 [Hortaea werneckii]KAI6925553.1 hypothetical protein KC341_g13330 [Hortaea werneckii]KAI6959331.1 hypothetical protein KC321_g13484 [Hortaea werneckii]KAI7008890.1 hypothetical protein KC362_g17432 [Hortaea werneckii]KAI7019487.1 hypothetical protein KC366_g14024 [Hortaea werneckii]
MSAAPSPTTTVFATNKFADVKAQLSIPKPLSTVQDIVPKTEKDEEIIPSSPKQDKAPEIQRPYLKLLMPQPPVDSEADIAARKQDCRYWFYVLGRSQKDKNWRSISVFPEDDVDEALSPFSIHFPDSDSDEDGDEDGDGDEGDSTEGVNMDAIKGDDEESNDKHNEAEGLVSSK